MASGRHSAKNKFSRVVRFAQTEADQGLLQAIDQALQDSGVSSFDELCKQALEQFLRSPAPTTTAIEPSSLPDPLTTLQQQIQALQLQVARLEGALGMQQTMHWATLEQRMNQVQQDLTEQLAQVNDRLALLESGTGVSTTDLPAPELAPEPDPPPEVVDPLLTRLVPLLEDF